MEPFRSVRGGGARARLAAAEASLLRSLVGQIMSLVESAGCRIRGRRIRGRRIRGRRIRKPSW